MKPKPLNPVTSNYDYKANFRRIKGEPIQSVYIENLNETPKKSPVLSLVDQYKISTAQIVKNKSTRRRNSPLSTNSKIKRSVYMEMEEHQHADDSYGGHSVSKYERERLKRRKRIHK